jgi:hypothetical protein
MHSLPFILYNVLMPLPKEASAHPGDEKGLPVISLDRQ